MNRRNVGFSMIEIMVVLLIMGIIIAIALPMANSALKGYKLHADATSISSYLNVVRMKAASQYAPYRLVINVASGTYTMEQLCGDKTTLGCTGTSFYNALSTPQLEGGTQYISQGNTFSSCRPSFITGSSYPGTITGDLSPCPDPLYIYFNTRGSPVSSTGGVIGNGGAVLYIYNQNHLTDAVSVSLGGRVSVSSWSGSAWVVR
jgi:prepilin-type N-terminal cleavage/methylation domain-containing protein